MVFNLVLANNTILLCLFPVGIPTIEEKAEFEIYMLIAKSKVIAQCDLQPYNHFYACYSLHLFVLFILRNNFLFHLFFLI